MVYYSAKNNGACSTSTDRKIVCACVCLCVCAYKCVVCVCVCVCMCACACMYVFVCACVYVCVTFILLLWGNILTIGGGKGIPGMYFHGTVHHWGMSAQELKQEPDDRTASHSVHHHLGLRNSTHNQGSPAETRGCCLLAHRLMLSYLPYTTNYYLPTE